MDKLNKYKLKGCAYVITTSPENAVNMVKGMTQLEEMSTEGDTIGVVNSEIIDDTRKEYKVIVELSVEAENRKRAIELTRTNYQLPTQVNLSVEGVFN